MVEVQQQNTKTVMTMTDWESADIMEEEEVECCWTEDTQIARHHRIE